MLTARFDGSLVVIPAAGVGNDVIAHCDLFFAIARGCDGLVRDIVNRKSNGRQAFHGGNTSETE